MREVMMFGIVLAFTGLLLLLRSLVVGRRAEKAYRIYVMTHPKVDDDDRPQPDSPDEWPSLIAAEDDSALETRTLSEDERIELAAMEERIFRLLR